MKKIVLFYILSFFYLENVSAAYVDMPVYTYFQLGQTFYLGAPGFTNMKYVDANVAYNNFGTAFSAISSKTGYIDYFYTRNTSGVDSSILTGSIVLFSDVPYNNGTITTLPSEIEFVGDKIKWQNKYFCAYYNTNPTPVLGTNDNRYHFTVGWDPGVPCYDGNDITATWYDVYEFHPIQYKPMGLTPPPYNGGGSVPISSSVNGLTCTVKNFPDIGNTIWYNFGSKPVQEDLSNTGSIRLKFSSSTGSITDYDILTYGKGDNFDLNPSVIPFDSVPYPGSLTEEAYLRSDGYLNLVSYSGGIQRGFNLIQLNAIGITEGSATVSSYVLKQDGTYSVGSPKTWSGTDLMIGFPESVKQIGLKYLTAFNGIRIGSAPNIQKTACSINFNICRWSIQGGSDFCGPDYAVNGLPLGECSVAGSGSIYGSGSCVPSVDGSGSIIPPNPLAGGYVILDGSGAVVGSVIPPIEEQNQEEINAIFSCGINNDDSWYLTLGKAIICPVTVVRNLFNSAYTNVTKTINGVNRINSVTSTISLTGSISTSTGSSTGNIIGNTLALKLQDIGKTGKGVHFVGRVYQMGWWALLLGFIIVVVVGSIIAIIKNKNGI